MIEIRTDDVLSRFAALSGREDVETYRTLCGDAAGEIGRVQRDSCGEDGRPALTAAAAALAFYRYTLARAGVGAGSFAAGDVKITEQAGNPSSAKALWNGAAAAAAPFLTDGGCFLFGRIRP
ncbi:hypothetical protein [Caproicibacter fermentans]|uniref:Uncharacterized protein n=1 Tax=Caproicibacter fermentans TaxID=2576756 RepID=A0A7G8T6S4_9FIRM|nr:hypothetical protein [Caproicibacter fermentans]QNK39315.1 hypothetical protein HCR03_11135 [Caproicibacter fermentans]